ncbi:hypothetical protein [Spartinivicinus ruber]|uniref:hypothetical protein n=1 Tax=Spartinivicinus ruber TaxID=2683272 RepID=UPI0013D1B619|nr:hypothetical protein [Spartinivicinus ruber]
MAYTAPINDIKIPDKRQLINSINDICLLYLTSKLTKTDYRITIEGSWPTTEEIDLPYLYFENINMPKAKDAGYIIETKAVFNYFNQYPEITDEMFNYELRALARSFCVPGSVWHCLGFSYFSFDFLFASRINEYSRQVSFPPDYQYLTDKQFPYYACLQLAEKEVTGVVLGKEHGQLIFRFFEDYTGAAPQWLPSTGDELYIDDANQHSIVLFEHDLLLVPEETTIIPDFFSEQATDISEEAITAHFSNLFLHTTPHKLDITAKANNVVSLQPIRQHYQAAETEDLSVITHEADEPTTEGLLTVLILAICLAVSAFLFEAYVL